MGYSGGVVPQMFPILARQTRLIHSALPVPESGLPLELLKSVPMPVRTTVVLLSEPGVVVGFHSVLPKSSTGKVGTERVEQGSSASAGMKRCDKSCLMTAYILFGPSQNGIICSPAVGRTRPGNGTAEVAACGCPRHGPSRPEGDAG